MQLSPKLLGATAAAAILGALTGASIATEPLTRGSDPLASIPSHDIAQHDAEEARAMIAPRNHYPLVTPQGVVEVAELAYRGRLRDETRYFVEEYEFPDHDFREIDHDYFDARHGEAEAAAERAARAAKPGPAFAVPASAEVRRVSAREPAAAEPLAAAPPKLEPSPRPSVTLRKPAQADGGPAVIDVAAELAARR